MCTKFPDWNPPLHPPRHFVWACRRKYWLSMRHYVTGNEKKVTSHVACFTAVTKCSYWGLFANIVKHVQTVYVHYLLSRIIHLTNQNRVFSSLTTKKNSCVHKCTKKVLFLLFSPKQNVIRVHAQHIKATVHKRQHQGTSGEENVSCDFGYPGGDRLLTSARQKLKWFLTSLICFIMSAMCSPLREKRDHTHSMILWSSTGFVFRKLHQSWIQS